MGAAAGNRALVADDATGEAGEDRREGGAARSIRHVPACRDRDSTAVVCGDAATDRWPAADGGADVTRRFIAAVGLNRRVPDSRRWRTAVFSHPDCVSARSRTHRASYPETPNRVAGSRFRSKHRCATVFGGWEESSGKSRIDSMTDLDDGMTKGALWRACVISSS